MNNHLAFCGDKCSGRIFEDICKSFYKKKEDICKYIFFETYKKDMLPISMMIMSL